MDIKAYNQDGKSAGATTVSDALFSARMNADLVWQVATSQMSNKRKVLAHAKTRAEVRGGGKKPWKQKGTGRARHGSIRSPIWIGGGVAHGPSKNVNFKKTITKIASRQALASVLSARVKDGAMMAVESFAVSSGKTKEGIRAIAALTKRFTGFMPSSRVLVVLSGSAADAPTVRALANVQNVQVMRAQDLNVLTVLAFPYIIATTEALTVADKTFSFKK